MGKCEHVDAAHRRADTIGEETQYGVADVVPVLVVDELEVVEVDERYRQRLTRPSSPLDLLVDPRREITLVVCEREVIGHREPTKSGTLDRRGAAVREQAREEPIILVESTPLLRCQREDPDDLPG